VQRPLSPSGTRTNRPWETMRMTSQVRAEHPLRLPSSHYNIRELIEYSVRRYLLKCFKYFVEHQRPAFVDLFNFTIGDCFPRTQKTPIKSNPQTCIQSGIILTTNLANRSAGDITQGRVDPVCIFE
jgi:hypothetical protein